MRSHKEEYDEFLGESVDEYLKSMEQPGTWGDELTLVKALFSIQQAFLSKQFRALSGINMCKSEKSSQPFGSSVPCLLDGHHMHLSYAKRRCSEKHCRFSLHQALLLPSKIMTPSPNEPQNEGRYSSELSL